MERLIIPGATIFMFNPLEKKWRQKANGDVTFSLNFKDLAITIGKLSFLVKGGVRSKGRGSVVMRVRDETSQDKGARILACRFERARDVQKLFELLSGRQHVPAAVQWPKRRTPPTWFLAMKKSDQQKVKALVSKANPRHIKDGIIQRELVMLYHMTAAQVKEVMEYFLKQKITIPVEETSPKSNHRRVFTQPCISSLTPSSPGWRVYPGQRPSNQLKGGNLNMGYAIANRRLKTPYVGGGVLQNLSPKMNSSDIPSNKAVHHDQTPRVRSSPRPEDSIKKKSRNPVNSRLADVGLGSPAAQNEVWHDNQIRGQSTPRKQRHKPPNDKQIKSLMKNPADRSKNIRSLDLARPKHAHLPVSLLTTQNLVLHNKMVAPMKGDYKTLVKRWLDNSLPSEE